MSGRGSSADWRSRSIAGQARGCRVEEELIESAGNPRPDPRRRERAAPQDRRPCQRPRAPGKRPTRWWTGARLSGWRADCAVVWLRPRRGTASRDSRRDGFLPRRGTAACSRRRRVVTVLGAYGVMTQIVVFEPCLRNRRRYQSPPVDGQGFPTHGVSTGLARCAAAACHLMRDDKYISSLANFSLTINRGKTLIPFLLTCHRVLVDSCSILVSAESGFCGGEAQERTDTRLAKAPAPVGGGGGPQWLRANVASQLGRAQRNGS